MSTTAEWRGPELLRAAVNHILDHPETWDQRYWHCRSTHCVAGICQILAGRPAAHSSCKSEVRNLLGISGAEADWLFSAHRSLAEIHGFAAALLRTGEFDPAGFDCDGYDRAGFDCDGFDRAGFDRAGFNQAGFDRAGFDRAGFNRAGFNRAGFDRAGFDPAGFDQAAKTLPKL